MLSVKIEKGNTESKPLTLGHRKLGAVFVPSFDEQDVVEILGSHDGQNYGPINDGLKFITHERYSVRTFDPGIFDSIQFVKFIVEKPAKEDLEFFVHIKDT